MALFSTVRTPGRRPVNLSIWGWFALALINCAIIIPYIGRHWLPPHDFGAFYAATQVHLQAAPDRLYDLDVQRQAEKRLYVIPEDQLQRRFLPFNHLPYEILLYLPLATVPPELAFWLWRLENFALLVFAIWLFSKTFPLRRGVAETLLMAFAFFPVPLCFLGGQDTFVTLALFVVAAWLLKKERPALAGAVLALGLFKFQLILPIIGIFFLRRAWRFIAGFTCAASAALAVSTLMVGYRGMASLVRLWVQGETGGIACINPLTMPNVRGLMACFTGLPSHAGTIATIIISVFLLVVAFCQSVTAPSSTHLLALGSCFVILISFHTNLYDFVILLLPILIVLEAYSHGNLCRWTVATPLFLLLCPLTYLAALAVFRVAQLSLVVVWLWYAVVRAMRQPASVCVLDAVTIREPAAVPSFAGAGQ